MKGVLVKYNKVFNHALTCMHDELSKNFDIQYLDLADYENKMDLLSFSEVSGFLGDHHPVYGKNPVDFLLIGDVFWRTGQNICRWCLENNVRCIFMQHGQWIYVKNKKHLSFYPDCTCLFGQHVFDMCKKWHYGSISELVITGNPRYDALSESVIEDYDGSSYIYFSPPVIEEEVHGRPSGRLRVPFLECLRYVVGLDREFHLVIHPHYRECRIQMLQDMFPSASFIKQSDDPLPLIAKSSAVLACRNSTAILDAIALHRPVFLIDFSDCDVSFFRRGYFRDFAVESNDLKSLKQELNMRENVHDKIEKNNDYRHDARRYILLGDASKRVVHAISSVLNSRLN